MTLSVDAVGHSETSNTYPHHKTLIYAFFTQAILYFLRSGGLCYLKVGVASDVQCVDVRYSRNDNRCTSLQSKLI